MAMGTHVAMFSFLVGSLLVNAPDKLNVRVNPPVILAGQATWLTCHVPRKPEHRTVAYGIAGYLDSQRQLEGENSQATWQVLVEHIPCGAGPAYCAVASNDGSVERVVAQLAISGCDQ